MPEGAQGLEGYNTDFLYRCELITCGKNGPYWKVWPEEDNSYYETCSMATFKRYFKVVPI
jgi:hypothetical protein